jgi:hypothetical protein
MDILYVDNTLTNAHTDETTETVPTDESTNTDETSRGRSSKMPADKTSKKVNVLSVIGFCSFMVIVLIIGKQSLYSAAE